MIKRLTRTCIAAGCRATALLPLAERRARGRLTILCYHRVLPAPGKAAYLFPELVVTPESFRQHCLTLRRHYDVLPLHQAVEALQAGRTGRRILAAVTFDDGYRDNFRYAAPILNETGIQATFFVIADLVGTQQPPWYDRLGRAVLALKNRGKPLDLLARFGKAGGLGGPDTKSFNGISPQQAVGRAKKATPAQRRELTERLCAEAGGDGHPSADDLIMDWQQLADLVAFGHEIGSHSCTHEILPQLDDATLESEVAGSRRTLEEGLCRPVRSFCYPNGDADRRVASAVETAGYTCAVAGEAGSNEPGRDAYYLRRSFIHEDRLAGPSGKASGSLLRMELCDLADRVFVRHQRRSLRGLP